MKKQRCISAKEKDGSLRILNLLSENEKTRDGFLQKNSMTGSLHRRNLLPKRKKLLWISAKNKNQWRQISAQHRETLSSKIQKEKRKKKKKKKKLRWISSAALLKLKKLFQKNEEL
jgi:hypothetical protein